jgi:hypothetical protein
MQYQIFSIWLHQEKPEVNTQISLNFNSFAQKNKKSNVKY